MLQFVGGVFQNIIDHFCRISVSHNHNVFPMREETWTETIWQKDFRWPLSSGSFGGIIESEEND